MSGLYSAIEQHWPGSAWCASVASQAQAALNGHPHGNLPGWRATLESLPLCEPSALIDRAAPELGAPVADPERLRDLLMQLHPWRKGPLRLGGVLIDSEWRSDRKWQRVAPHVELHGRRILDIGCGNGYFGLRMLGCGARLVIGIDPTPLFVMQWLACRHFSGALPNFVLPLRAEDLPRGRPGFDLVFCMGVLYHRRDPAGLLRQIRGLLRNGGTVVLETLVLPEKQPSKVLLAPPRYARMANVWAVPGTDRLLNWVGNAGFRGVNLVGVSRTTVAEQRSTPWMQFESLEQALDPEDRTRTVEGHPAPVRAVVIARR